MTSSITWLSFFLLLWQDFINELKKKDIWGFRYVGRLKITSRRLPWAVTSQRDTRRVRLANIARSNMAAFSVRLLQLQQVAENPSLEQEEFLYICACQSDKQSLGFLNTDPQSQVLFNWSGLSELSRAATCIRRSMNFFLQLVPMNLYTRSSQVTDCRRNPVNEETRQTCISGHLQAFANVLKQHIKSVFPKKRNTKGRCCRFWFNS